MWRERQTHFSGVVALALFGGTALIAITVNLLTPTPTTPDMQIIRLNREFRDDFGLNADAWQGSLFTWDDTRSTLSGVVPGGRGYAVAVRDGDHGNTEIAAQVRTAPVAGDNVVSVGVVCRAGASGNGYYFLIASTQRASIQLGAPGSDDLTLLVDWATHDAIQPLDAGNVIQAACVNDYLTFSVNGVFIAEARDDTLSRGQVGVALAGTDPNRPATAEYDTVTAWEAVARQ
jgi:hypothetical protein